MSSATQMPDARSILERYIADKYNGLPVPGTGIRRAIGALLPRSWRPAVRRIGTNCAAPHARLVAARLAGSGPVKLHLGCGESPKPGWVNVDLVGLPTDLAWNLDRSLPFADCTVDAIFHEHVLEHLELDRGLAMVRECFRVLKPGGLLRIGVPDARKYIESYCESSHSFLRSVRPGRPTPLLALQEEFYSHGHRTMYDFETIELVGRAAGFHRVTQRNAGDSTLSPCPDSAHRDADTLYVEMER
ncbi:MAG: class I SAM-dependent methyltransferase [Actinomycetota bacterium]